MSKRTPYDTGKRAEPKVWGRGHLEDDDDYGKVDFENDEGGTLATLYIEQSDDRSTYTLKGYANEPLKVEIEQEDPAVRLNVAGGERTLFPVNQQTQIALTAFEGDSMGRALVRLEDPHDTDRDEWTETTDLLTGHTIAVRRADCGLGCKCAAEVKLIRYAEEEEE